MNKIVIWLFAGLLAICGCRDSFSPRVDAQYQNLLVVEGFIHVGGKTVIRLSRTGELSDRQSRIPEKNAEVIIEGEQGTIVKGISAADGRHNLETQNLSIGERYRLKIVTNEKTYQTEYLDNKTSPEIESLDFRIENKGFQVYLNTRDDANKTRYYHWNFTETWEVRSAFPSAFEYKNGQVVHRDRAVNIEYCWAEDQSSTILLGSSERLLEDKLTMVPINHVLGNSAKVVHMYSILVKQYGLTREAYHYLENMKKNTEQIGTIFDPQPSELRGNVRCLSNPEEQVLGWISAGTVSEKRIFISYKDKPKTGSAYDWLHIQRCEPLTSSQDSLLYYLFARNLIISENRRPNEDGSILINYTMAPEDCIDCRLRGTNIKPDYWPN